MSCTYLRSSCGKSKFQKDTYYANNKYPFIQTVYSSDIIVPDKEVNYLHGWIVPSDAYILGIVMEK